MSADEKPKAKRYRNISGIIAHQFKKGQPSPNPSGRPKKRPITDRYVEALETVLPTEIAKQAGLKDGATIADLIARNMVMRAVRSPKAVEATREIREAVEGRAPLGVNRLQSGEMVIHVAYASPSIANSDDVIDDDSGS